MIRAYSLVHVNPDGMSFDQDISKRDIGNLIPDGIISYGHEAISTAKTHHPVFIKEKKNQPPGTSHAPTSDFQLMLRTHQTIFLRDIPGFWGPTGKIIGTTRELMIDALIGSVEGDNNKFKVRSKAWEWKEIEFVLDAIVRRAMFSGLLSFILFEERLFEGSLVREVELFTLEFQIDRFHWILKDLS